MKSMGIAVYKHRKAADTSDPHSRYSSEVVVYTNKLPVDTPQCHVTESGADDKRDKSANLESQLHLSLRRNQEPVTPDSHLQPAERRNHVNSVDGPPVEKRLDSPATRRAACSCPPGDAVGDAAGDAPPDDDGDGDDCELRVVAERNNASVNSPIDRFRRSNFQSFPSVDTTMTDYYSDKTEPSCADMLFCCFRIVTYIIDVATDLILTYEYYKKCHIYWFSYTLSFILFPSVIMSIFTFVLYMRDWRMMGIQASVWSWVSRFFFLLFQLAPLIRIIETTFYACKSKFARNANKRREYFERWLDEDTDSMLLRLFEAFLEAAPQLVLQIYIICRLKIFDIHSGPSGPTNGTSCAELVGVANFSSASPIGHDQSTDPSIVLQIVGLLTSWLTMTSTIVTFQKSLRMSQQHKAKLRFLGMATMFCWRLFTISSRVMALALFGFVRGFDLFWVLIAHWVLMLMWVSMQHTTYCVVWDGNGREVESPLPEFGFRVINAFIHIFCFFNLIEGYTRLRCATYYTIVYIENVAMVLTWYYTVSTWTTDTTWYVIPALLIVLVGFWIGIFFQLLYYKYFHPNNMSPDHTSKKIKWSIPCSDAYLCKDGL